MLVFISSGFHILQCHEQFHLQMNDSGVHTYPSAMNNFMYRQMILACRVQSLLRNKVIFEDCFYFLLLPKCNFIFLLIRTANNYSMSVKVTEFIVTVSYNVIWLMENVKFPQILARVQWPEPCCHRVGRRTEKVSLCTHMTSYALTAWCIAWAYTASLVQTIAY